MSDPTLPPARMRYSYESRCRVVQALLDGATPEEAAVSHGASRSSGRPPSTVGKVLRRHGRSRLPREPRRAG